MDDLTRYRAEIDEIDAQMILLFERRMDIVRQVALYKKTRGMFWTKRPPALPTKITPMKRSVL